MAQATNSYSISDAAREIRALINSRSHSPSQPEIEALLAKVTLEPIARTGWTITSTAQEIADLWVLMSAFDSADALQAEGRPNDADADKQFVASCRPIDFESYDAAADRRKDALEEILIGLEPQSLDEMLSLVLILNSHFDGYVSDYTGGANHNPSARCERDGDTIERALDALVRWLVVGGAKSPILGIYAVPWKLAPLDQQIATAFNRALELHAQAGSDT